MASPNNVDATATASSETLPLRICWIIYKEVVPHMSVCIATTKQKNFMGTVPSLQELKPMDPNADVSDEQTSLSVIATDETSPTDDTSPFYEKPLPLEVVADI